MKRFLAYLVLLPLLAGISSLAACGGDDELTIEQYFERVQTVSEERGAGSDGLEEDFNELEEDDFDGLQDLFAELGKIVEDGLKDVDGLNPPAEAADEHEEFVEAGLAMLDEFDKMVDEVGKAETREEAFAAIAGTPELQAADARFEAACIALEAVASNAGIDADLDCGGSGD